MRLTGKWGFMTKLHVEIIEKLNGGMTPKAVAHACGCNYSTVLKVRKEHADILTQNRDIKQVDISNFDSDLSNNLKQLILYVSNILTRKCLTKESSPQLMKTIGIAFDKLRLLDGKATSIVENNITSMTDDERAIYADLIRKYHEEKLGVPPGTSVN